jgi:hypothetical protein
MKLRILCIALLLSGALFHPAIAQVDEEEEDYSQYDNLDFTDGGAKRFCSSKIKGLSPAKLISLGYDVQGPFTITAGEYGTYASEERSVDLVHGLRFFANIPIISRNNIIIQGGVNHASSRFEYAEVQLGVLPHPLHRALETGGLQTTGINTTVFKPLNEKAFVLFQASADVNGNYGFNTIQSPRTALFSAAALWGKRPSDNKQWAVGLSRTYRAGELNYIPVVLFNWTSISGKWGTEMLLPARGHVRYSFSPRSMLFAGWELEGQSYQLNNTPYDTWLSDGTELRRSELRFRLIYERSIYNFIWISAQAGYRVNYLFNVDDLADGTDFFRGFFGDQPFAMENQMGNPLYFNISLNLVSP